MSSSSLLFYVMKHSRKEYSKRLRKIVKQQHEIHFPTFNHLLEKVEHELDENNHLEFYQELLPACKEQRFKLAFHFTFTKPVTDPIVVTSVNRKIKQSVSRYIFRRQAPDLNFLFFIERHRNHHKYQPKYHVHALVSHPPDPFGRLHLLSKTKIDHYLKKGACSLFEILLLDKIKKTRLDDLTPRKNLKIDEIEITPIFSVEGLYDYLMKPLRREPDELYIDYLNSDLNFEFKD